MYAKSFIALSGLLSLAAAAPLAAKRDVVWVTHTDETITTVPVTMTVWVDPTDTRLNDNFHPRPTDHYSEPAFASAPAVSSAAPVETSAAAAPVVPSPAPVESSPVAPSSAAAPSSPQSTPAAAPTTLSTSTTPAYVAPAPTTTSTTPVYVAPTTPAAPATTSVQAAPVVPVASSSWAAAPPPATSTTPASSGNVITASASSSWNCPANFGSGASVSGSGAPGTAYTGDLTYFQDGMGACGCTNGDSDHIVAISQAIFDAYTTGGNPNNNPLCGKKVMIHGAGGSFEAVITDRCVGCASGDLDMPEPLFNAVTNNGDGRVHGQSWSFM